MFKFLGAAFIVALIVLFQCQARAADRADMVESYNPQEYCEFTTTLFAHGMNHRLENHSSEIANWIKDTPTGCVEQPPVLGKIYVCDWDNYTANEKRFVGELLIKGWTFADRAIEKGMEVNIQRFGAMYFDNCMKERTAKYLKRHRI
jgi:hypothetical protein